MNRRCGVLAASGCGCPIAAVLPVRGIGAVVSLRSVWALSDIANGLMAIPNLLGLVLLGWRVSDRLPEK